MSARFAVLLGSADRQMLRCASGVTPDELPVLLWEGCTPAAGELLCEQGGVTSAHADLVEALELPMTGSPIVVLTGSQTVATIAIVRPDLRVLAVKPAAVNEHPAAGGVGGRETSEIARMLEASARLLPAAPAAPLDGGQLTAPANRLLSLASQLHHAAARAADPAGSPWRRRALLRQIRELRAAAIRMPGPGPRPQRG
jgi:hypothetical protein